MRNFSSIGMVLALLCTVPTSALALGSTQTRPGNGFLDQEKPDWIEALPIPEELYPTLEEAISAANLITHEASKLRISSPTYDQAHRLLLQNLLMMRRQLYLSPDDLALFQSRTHLARSTVDPRIYLPNPTGGVAPQMSESLPTSIVETGNTAAYHTYAGDAPSRRSIVLASEERD